MAGISKAVSESLYKKAQESLKEVAKSGDISRKLQAIMSSKTYGISTISKIFGISRVTLMEWIHKFSRNGVEGLQLQAGRGRKPVLSASEIEQVRKIIEADHNVTIKAVRLKIQDLFSKELSKSAVHNLLKNLGFSYITGRPSHYKKVLLSQEEFKKKSAEES